MRDGTLVVHAGRPRQAGTPPLAGPVFAAHFAAPEGMQVDSYGRHENPTYRAYEAALGALDGGLSVAFASGMAAVDAVFGCVLRRGDVVVMQVGAYYTARVLVEQYARSHDVAVRLVTRSELPSSQALDGARLLWLETPANPWLDVADIAGHVAAARGAGVLVAVDNSVATPLATRPLALGADFAVSSDSKSLTGHGDLILGHVSAREARHAQKLVNWRTLHGAVPGPMEVFLAHRSLATLELRLQRSCGNAARIAAFLQERHDVADVRYPGLATDGIAARQMRYFGPLVCFDVGSRGRANAFLKGLTIVTEATGFGAVTTTAERRGRWGGDAVPEGFIRLSAGCEDADDLLDDIARALDAAAAA